MEDLIFESPVVFEKEILIDTEDDLNAEQVKKAVNRIAYEQGFRNFRICTNDLNFDGASFLSRACTIDIIDLDTQKEVNLFVKNLTVIAENMTIFLIEDTFERESFFYNDLARKFVEIQNKFNLPEPERYRLVKSYKSETNSMIIMENLMRQGYEMPDRMEISSLDYVKKSIKELAKFKALSMALEKHRPNYFEEVIKPLGYLLKPDESFVEATTKMLVTDINVQRNEIVREKLAKRVPNMYKQFIKYLSSQDATCGLTHNDYKPSNSLIKLENGKIIDLINVDYQFLGYTNLINDFILFIFTSTDRQFRQAHLEYIKNYFHDSIAKSLNYYHIDINDVYPKDVFEREFNDRLELGLMAGLVMLPVLLASVDDLPDISDPGDDWLLKKRSAECLRRMNDIAEEFLEWGLL